MNWKVIPLIIILTGCQDIFTTNLLVALKEDPSNMSSEALLADAESGNPEAIAVLEEKRVTKEDVQNNSELKEQFVDETSLLADVKIEQADFVGAIDDLINADENEGGAEAVLDEILADEDRVKDFKAGADYIVELYEVAPEEVTDTQKIAGTVGLMSDIVSDDKKNAKLQEELEDVELADLNTEELDPEVFTEEDKKKIVSAQKLVTDIESTEELGFDISEILGGGGGED